MILGLAIFAADLFSPLPGAVAVLYIAVVLLIARAASRQAVLMSGLVCTLLTLIAFIAGHLGEPIDSAYVRLAVSLVAIAAATLLSIRDHSARTTLAEQARLLELSHDTVIIRDANDIIVYWNDGAEQLYGWTRAEALGRSRADLLHCEIPTDVVAHSLEADGQWSGELLRTRRDGSRIVLATRWLLRRDPEGRGIGVIESSADVTEQLRADAERRRSEQRYSTIFHAAGFPIWESDWSETRRLLLDAAPNGTVLRPWLATHPEIVARAVSQASIGDVNEAAVTLFGAEHPDQLVGRNVIGKLVPGSEPLAVDVLASLFEGAETVECEARYLNLQGRPIDVVVRVRLLPEGEPWSRMLMMALDVTERNEARAKIEQASTELAHAARVSTLGQLAASIAHEVNQPLSAIINYGKSGKRWLSRDVPDTDEVANCLDHVVANASRAADVIARVRSLARKAAPEVDALNLAELVEEAVALVQREASSARVVIHRVNPDTVPAAMGDRVQVQQVLVNLLMNAIQAMRDVQGRTRELCIRLRADGDMVRIAVEDCGPGITGDSARIFEPFFTTKREGMGMGLSICRSIVEAQGGRIKATNNPDRGATVAFTLPAQTGVATALPVAHDTSV